MPSAFGTGQSKKPGFPRKTSPWSRQVSIHVSHDLLDLKVWINKKLNQKWKLDLKPRHSNMGCRSTKQQLYPLYHNACFKKNFFLHINVEKWMPFKYCFRYFLKWFFLNHLEDWVTEWEGGLLSACSLPRWSWKETKTQVWALCPWNSKKENLLTGSLLLHISKDQSNLLPSQSGHFFTHREQDTPRLKSCFSPYPWDPKL